MANKHPTIFILKVLERSGCGLIELRETRLWRLFNFKVLSFEYWKSEISKVVKSPSWHEYMSQYIPHLNQGEWVSPLVNSQQKLGSGGAHDQQNKQQMANTNKKPKQNLWIQFRKWNNRISYICCIKIMRRNSYNQRVFFLDWKNNLQLGKHSNCENIKSGNLLVELNKKKMLKTFHNLKCKIYLHKRLNSLKRVIWKIVILNYTRGNTNSLRKVRGHELQKDNH